MVEGEGSLHSVTLDSVPACRKKHFRCVLKNCQTNLFPLRLGIEIYSRVIMKMLLPVHSHNFDAASWLFLGTFAEVFCAQLHQVSTPCVLRHVRACWKRVRWSRAEFARAHSTLTSLWGKKFFQRPEAVF